MAETNETNTVSLCGIIANTPHEDFQYHDETFYTFDVSIPRKNPDTLDTIPVLIPENLVDSEKHVIGANVLINGKYQMRTSPGKDGELKPMLKVIVSSISIFDDIVPIGVNNVWLEGFIVKPPVLRTTPKTSRTICDLRIAVNRGYGKTDYIPVITWGGTGVQASKYQVGSKVSIAGRIQSRAYLKEFDGKTEMRVTYEVSATSCILLRGTED